MGGHKIEMERGYFGKVDTELCDIMIWGQYTVPHGSRFRDEERERTGMVRRDVI